MAGPECFARANIGILTGTLSKVTIVDCDGEGVADEALGIFGETPLITATSSGGHYLWYRANGERCRNLRSSGYAIDVKAIGGLTVVPPSVRTNGPHVGRTYRFVSGTLDNVHALPPILGAAVDRFDLCRKNGAAPMPGNLSRSPGAVTEGQRNIHLFAEGLRVARVAHGQDAVLMDLVNLNEFDCEPPLPESEVHQGVKAPTDSGRERWTP